MQSTLGEDEKIRLFSCTDHIIFDELLSRHTSFGIGGPAKAYAQPKSANELQNLLEVCKRFGIRTFLLGNGTNVLFPDKGFDGLVISMKGLDFIHRTGNYVCAGAGVNLFALGRFLRENGLSGFEFAYGIPGTAGGAVVQNAGAYGDEISPLVQSVTVLKNGSLKQWNMSEKCPSGKWFAYRNSYFKRVGLPILSATFLFREGSSEAIEKNQRELFAMRLDKQPITEKNAGSIFKRKGNILPAKLIDELGLKGTSFGGAMISPKHAGFIINTGTATAADVLELIDFIKERVYSVYHIKLEEEIEIIR